MEGFTPLIGCFAVLSSPVILLAGLMVADMLNIRLMSATGFAPIAMDGATCLKTKDDRIVIKPRRFFNWLVIIVLGAFELGLLAVIVRAVINWQSGKEMGEQIGTALGAGVLVAATFFATARSLRRAFIFLDLNSRLLVVGDGPDARQIPFSRVLKVNASSPTPTVSADVVRSYILVALEDGETIEIGSVSGKEQSMRTSAKAIVELIRNATGVKPLAAGA